MYRQESASQHLAPAWLACGRSPKALRPLESVDASRELYEAPGTFLEGMATTEHVSVGRNHRGTDSDKAQRLHLSTAVASCASCEDNCGRRSAAWAAAASRSLYALTQIWKLKADREERMSERERRPSCRTAHSPEMVMPHSPSYRNADALMTSIMTEMGITNSDLISELSLSVQGRHALFRWVQNCTYKSRSSKHVAFKKAQSPLHPFHLRLILYTGIACKHFQSKRTRARVGHMDCASRCEEDVEDVDAGDDAGADALDAILGPPFWVAFTTTCKVSMSHCHPKNSPA